MGVDDVFQSTERVLCMSSAAFKGKLFEPGVVRFLIEKGWVGSTELVSRIPILCQRKVFNVTWDTTDKRITKYDKDILEHVPELRGLDKESSHYKSILSYYRLVRLLRDEAMDCAGRYNYGNPLYPSSVGNNPSLCSIIYYDLGLFPQIYSNFINFEESSFGCFSWGADDDIKKFISQNYKNCGGLLFPNVYTSSDSESKTLQANVNYNKATHSYSVTDEDGVTKTYYGLPVSNVGSSNLPNCPSPGVFTTGPYNNHYNSITGKKIVDEYLSGKILDVSTRNSYWCQFGCGCVGDSCLWRREKPASASYFCVNITFEPEWRGGEYKIAQKVRGTDPEFPSDPEGLLLDIVKKASSNKSEEHANLLAVEEFFKKVPELTVMGNGNWICSATSPEPPTPHFERVTDSVPWGPLFSGYDSVVFDDKIWVIGGSSNRIWYSEDGETWNETHNDELLREGFGPYRRMGHAAVVFDSSVWGHRLFVLGGEPLGERGGTLSLTKEGFSPETNQASWSPSPGWLPYGGDASLSGHAAVVFKDEILSLGGCYIYSLSSISFKNNIYNSSNGGNWGEIETSGDMWSGRCGHAATVFDDKIWVMGGVDNTKRVRDDLWYSEDGVTWTKVDVKLPPLSGHSLLVVNDTMFIVGGSGTYSVFLYSKDGKKWFSSPYEPLYGPIQGHSAVVFNDKMFVMTDSGVWAVSPFSMIDCPPRPFLEGDRMDVFSPYTSSDYRKRVINPSTLSSGVAYVGFLDFHSYYQDPLADIKSRAKWGLVGAFLGPGGAILGWAFGGASSPKDAYEAQEWKPTFWGGDWVKVYTTTGTLLDSPSLLLAEDIWMGQKIIKPANDKILLVFDDYSWDLPGLGVISDRI